jgi:hypothetical protein
MQLPPSFTGRAVLMVAHPGHELRVHGWLELARPQVWVLTDGSGHGGRSRLTSTSAVLAQAGGSTGAIYGRYSDRAAYEMILAGDSAAIFALVEDLAAALLGDDVSYVAGDALEGFNPVHDLCRVVIDAAVALAARRGRREIGNFDFPLEAAPDTPSGDRDAGEDDEGGSAAAGLRLELSAAAIERKLAAAHGYPELLPEVERALQLYGPAAFGVERLRPVETDRAPLERIVDPPPYERYGAERVAAGHYHQVLQLRGHFLPLAEAVAARARSA